MPSRFLLLGLFFLALVLGACQQQRDVAQTEGGQLVLGSAEVTSEITRGVIPGSRTLVLDGFSGRVELQGTMASQANLTFVKRARGDDDVGARRLLDRIEIDEAGDETSYRYTMRSDRPQMTSVDVLGEIPTGTALRIELDNGPVTLTGVDGPIEIDVENAPAVTIDGAASTVEVELLNGQIDVTMQALPSDAAITVRNTNGSITLALPATAAARIEARTTAGQINTAGLDFTSRRLNPTAAGARFNGQLGSGNAVVDLRTENGTITLRQATASPLPPPPAPPEESTDTPPDTADAMVPPAPELDADTARVTVDI